tara:strand:+ start:4159 stop:5847 length:1689 start_codon:yes stop_codon:yes gene_type:complete
MAKEVNVNINFETKSAQKDLKNLDKDLKGVGETAEETGNKAKAAGKDVLSMGGGGKKAGKDAEKGAKGWKTLGRAMKATGIGLLVGILVKFSQVLGGNQRVMDFVNVAGERMSIIFSDLINWVVDGIAKLSDFKNTFSGLGDTIAEFPKMIKDYIIDTFKQVMDGIGLLGQAIAKLFKGEFAEAGELAKKGAKTLWNAMPVVQLGKKVVELTKTVVEYVKKTTKAAKAIVNTRNAMIDLTASIKNQQVELQAQLELETRVRDNENKTFEQRLTASAEIMRISDEMRKNDKTLLQSKIDNAAAELRVNSDNKQMLADLNILKAEMVALEGEHTQAILDETQAHHDLIKGQSDSIIELNDLNLQGYDREMSDLKKYYKERLEEARKSGKGEVAVKEEYNRKKEEIEKKYVRKTIQATADFIGALASTQAKGSGAWKKMATAQALINTYLGVTSALKDPEMPFVARLLNAGTQLLMGMNNVRAISSTKIEGASGDDGNTGEDTVSGGGGGGGGGAQLPEVSSLIPEQLVENIGGVGGGAIQAYVVESNISSSQALQQELEIQSTL